MFFSLLISALAVGLLGAVAYKREHAEWHSTSEWKFKRSLRVTLGFLIAPLTAALLVTVHFNYLRWREGLASPFIYGLGDMVLAYLFALVLCLLFGLPAYLYLRHRVSITARASAIAGGIIGLMLAIVVAIPSIAYISHGILAVNLALYALIGAASGLTFWLVGRPDGATGKLHSHFHNGSHHHSAA